VSIKRVFPKGVGIKRSGRGRKPLKSFAIERSFPDGVGIENPHGGLSSNAVRAALYYAGKQPISEAPPSAEGNYVFEDGNNYVFEDGNNFIFN